MNIRYGLVCFMVFLSQSNIKVNGGIIFHKQIFANRKIVLAICGGLALHQLQAKVYQEEYSQTMNVWVASGCKEFALGEKAVSLICGQECTKLVGV